MLLRVSLTFSCFCVCFVWVSVFKITKRSKSNLSTYLFIVLLIPSLSISLFSPLPFYIFLPAHFSLYFFFSLPAGLHLSPSSSTPGQTVLKSVQRHQPSSVWRAGLFLVIARSRALCFAPELHTPSCTCTMHRPPGHRVRCWRKIRTPRQAHIKPNKLASHMSRFQSVPVNFPWKLTKEKVVKCQSLELAGWYQTVPYLRLESHVGWHIAMRSYLPTN
jgi:hypothetical protein